MNLFDYILGIGFFSKQYLTSKPSWNMMTSSKTSRDFDYYFGIFWKTLCSTNLMQS